MATALQLAREVERKVRRLVRERALTVRKEIPNARAKCGPSSGIPIVSDLTRATWTLRNVPAWPTRLTPRGADQRLGSLPVALLMRTSGRIEGFIKHAAITASWLEPNLGLPWYGWRIWRLVKATDASRRRISEGRVFFRLFSELPSPKGVYKYLGNLRQSLAN